MNIVINEDLKAYIDPLTPDEHAALERSILAEGCRDALVLWGDMLVDGHNRYGICQQHGLPFQTVQNTRFQSLEDVHLWMIDQHLGRRSVSDYQRGVLALRKRAIVAQRQAAATATRDPAAPGDAEPEADIAAPPDADGGMLASREAVARAARLSRSQVVMIEKIQQQAAPELVAAVKSGAISLTAAAAVATLPAPEQVAAATAGPQELKRAARQVREGRSRRPRSDASQEPQGSAEAGGPSAALPDDDIHALRARVAELTAENQTLRAQLAALQAGSPPF